MTLARRLAKVEESLTPTELAVRWLDEAHAHGGIEAHARANLEDESAEPPLNVLARAASSGVRSRLRGKPLADVAKAADAAVFQVVFRYELFVRILHLSHDLIDRETLLGMVLAGRLALLCSSIEGRPRDPTDAERFHELLELMLGRIVELRAFARARERVEELYLAGHPALYPEDQAAWAERVKETSELGFTAIGLAELHGLAGSASAPDPEPSDERIATFMTDFVEPAKVETFELLDDGSRAFRTARSWLRGKLAPVSRAPTSADELATPGARE